MVGIFDYFDVLTGLTQPDFYMAFSFHGFQLESYPVSSPEMLDTTSMMVGVLSHYATSGVRQFCRTVVRYTGVSIILVRLQASRPPLLPFQLAQFNFNGFELSTCVQFL